MISETLYEQERTILQFPDGARAYAHTFSRTEDSALVVTDAITGASTIPAGTIYPANDATAKGVLLKTVDVTSGSETGALLFAGEVKTSHLPAEPTDAAKKALPRITWFPDVTYPAASGVGSKTKIAALAAVSAADATDAATAATLANANKTAINAIIAALKA